MAANAVDKSRTLMPTPRTLTCLLAIKNSGGSIAVEKQNASLHEKPSLSLGFHPNFRQKLICMKLLVFAHTPPPHHGQSYMVKLMLDGFGGDCRRRNSPAPFGINCYHINTRYSKTLEDIGEFQGTKIFLILFYCLQAIWCRFRYGVDNFYYVPAPGKSVALYRDWLVLLVCRPFFKNVIFNWRAAGLAKWLETNTNNWMRRFTYKRMKDADASIVLSDFSRIDAEKFMARRVITVAGGISDPCPNFNSGILPRRRENVAIRKKI